MPRGIARTDAAPGVASYTLGSGVSFTVASLTVLVDATHANDDDLVLCEARDPFGGVIYRQPIGFIHGAKVFYSLAFGAEAIVGDDSADSDWPQHQFLNSDTVASEGLPALSLTPGCTVYVYTPLGMPDPTTDPLGNLDTGVVVSGLYLWVDVDDAGADAAPVALPAALAYEPTMSV